MPNPGEDSRLELHTYFSSYFGEDNTRTRNRTATGRQDAYDATSMYNPELDIWVGPCNIDSRIEVNNGLINRAVETYTDFLSEINKYAVKPYDQYFLNKNPRYFLAIEVGGSGSRKHRLGEMFNIAILGKIGIMVGVADSDIDIYLKAYEYINFASRNEKTTAHLNNVAIIKEDALIAVFDSLNKI